MFSIPELDEDVGSDSDVYFEAVETPVEDCVPREDTDATAAKQVEAESKSDSEHRARRGDRPAVVDTPARAPRPQRERRRPARYND